MTQKSTQMEALEELKEKELLLTCKFFLLAGQDFTRHPKAPTKLIVREMREATHRKGVFEELANLEKELQQAYDYEGWSDDLTTRALLVAEAHNESQQHVTLKKLWTRGPALYRFWRKLDDEGGAEAIANEIKRNHKNHWDEYEELCLDVFSDLEQDEAIQEMTKTVMAVAVARGTLSHLPETVDELHEAVKELKDRRE